MDTEQEVGESAGESWPGGSGATILCLCLFVLLRLLFPDSCAFLLRSKVYASSNVKLLKNLLLAKVQQTAGLDKTTQGFRFQRRMVSALSLDNLLKKIKNI